MKIIVASLFILVGLINFAPVAGVLGAPYLEEMYGISGLADDVLMLMRHRAVLLAVVGCLLLTAAAQPQLRIVAAAAGFASMISFLGLYLSGTPTSLELAGVFRIDVVAVLLLAVAVMADRRTGLSQRARA